MEYVIYAITVAIRLAVTPFVLLFALYQHLRAVYKGKVLVIYVDESRDVPRTGGSDNGAGSAGVDDTLAAIRAKAGHTGKVQRAGGLGK